MTNKKKWLAVMMMAFIFGMTIVENLDAQADNRLNGTWDVGSDRKVKGIELTLNNGNYERSISNNQFERGTYVANNGKITFRQTHIMYIDSKTTAEIGLESAKWYTINEFATAMRNSYKKAGAPQEFLNDILEPILEPNISALPQDYSIVGNSLIITYPVPGFEGEKYTLVYNRK